jgi:hypothetical protein
VRKDGTAVYTDEERDELWSNPFQGDGKKAGDRGIGPGGVECVTGLGAVRGKSEKKNQISLDIKHRSRRSKEKIKEETSYSIPFLTSSTSR